MTRTRLLSLPALFVLALFVTLAARGNAGCVLILGDSIGAGFGVPVEQGWGSLLAQRLDGCAVVNASISGETTEGGKARLPQLLAEYRPRIVVLELGGNDGLRGFAPAVIHANLAQMIADARHAGAKVLLLGMRIPPNYGPRYTTAFHAIYGTLAEQTTSALVPFLLEGIAINRELMQEDGIHPNAAAQPLILANVLPALSALLRD
jgi:acyl-CoA thioesterase-1